MKRLIALFASLLAVAGIVTSVPANAAPPPTVTITCTWAGCVGYGQIGPLRVETIATPDGSAVLICVGTWTPDRPCKIGGAELVLTRRYILGSAEAFEAVGGTVYLTASYIAGFLGTRKVLIGVVGSPSSDVVFVLSQHIHRCIIWDGSALRNVRC